MAKIQKKKDELLSAALRVISKYGLNGATIARILKEADAGYGTLYNYFSSKDELLQELFARLMNKMSDHVLSGYDPDAAVRLSFEQLMSKYLDYILQYYDEVDCMEQYYFIIYRQTGDNDTFGPFISTVDNIIRRGQAEKLIVEGDPIMLRQMAFGTVVKAVKGARVGMYEISPAAKEFIIAHSWNTIKA